MTQGPVGGRRRPVPALLPAAAGAAAALLALSTLGLTWVRRSTEGPLGEAGAAQVEVLTGRDVAPVVAALVPATTAVVVVALLLRGRWRAGALVVGALTALGAGAAAVVRALGPAAAGEQATLVPWLTAAACLVAALSALLGAVLTLGGPRSRRAGAAAPRHDGPAAPPADEGRDDLWHALDQGRDPTDAGN